MEGFFGNLKFTIYHNHIPYVDETPSDQLHNESDSGNVNQTQQSSKRKQASADERTESKTQKVGRERAKCWGHYEVVYLEEDDGQKRKYGKCKYCTTAIKADPNRNGTTGLKKHLLSCQNNPEVVSKKKQNNLVFKKESDGEGSVTVWKHDEVRINKALLDLFVVAELPFKLVENPAFIEFTNSLNGKFSLPSRHKVSKDVGKYYINERNKLMAYLSKPTNTIHLTTDTWTSSCQRVNYMVLTAHFIDDDWVMHKRIINFRPINSHKGDNMARELLDCIRGWGIKNVMTMTVDNASSNDKAIEFIVQKLPNLYDSGKHFHIRCMAHILNLIVKDGLMEHKHHVDCFRKAVHYVRNSSQRITNFKKCMKDSIVESKKFLCGDCTTRWNSTYDMLKIAVDLKEVFASFEIEDHNYFRDLERIPGSVDFDVCKILVDFLEKFKVKTDLVSATSKPLAHLFIREILDVDKHLRNWEVHLDFCRMAGSMRKKYDKYWGAYDKLNDFMYFANILDPTMKLSFVEHCFTKMIMYDVTKEKPMSQEKVKEKVSVMVLEVENRLHALFKTYKEKFDKIEYNSVSQESRNEDVVDCDDGNDFFSEYLNVEESDSVAIETELKRYLQEPKINFSKRFDILMWWKQNAISFPIVSRMAKDILAIQISTVASESAFSTSGRVLDPYRTRLSTSIVEALICTQDWVRKSRKPIVDDIDDLLKDDDITIEIGNEIKKQSEKGKGIMHDA